MWFGGGLGLTWQVNVVKNAFKFLLILLILSQKHILGVKKVVWDGLDVVWGGLEVFWGGLGCFGVVWGVSTDPLNIAQFCDDPKKTSTKDSYPKENSFF